MESGTSNVISESGVVVSSRRKALGGIRMENPFAFKVGQVFTGFGVGCGIGIGVGRPMNLGFFKPKNGEHRESLAKKPCAIPMVSQVMSATRGATDAFSGVSRHLNNGLRKIGAKNIEAGIGCGVGFGHGFGVGLAVKPGVVHQIQSSLVQAMVKLMSKFGVAPNLSSIGQGDLPTSLQSSMGMINQPTNQNPLGNSTQLATRIPEHPSQNVPRYEVDTGSISEKLAHKSTSVDTSFGRTEEVLSNFLQNPLLKEESTDINELAGRLRSENNMLQMVLKHQRVIEELVEENEKLRQILVEDLKIPPSKLQTSYSNRNKTPCTNCFECRRKQRRR